MSTTAWHNNPDLKAEVMQRLRAHRAADEIVQGIYQEIAPDVASGYRGCAIGCTLPLQPNHGGWGLYPSAPDEGWHGEVERLYGIPYWIGSAIDDLFESLPPSDCGDFAVGVIEAIPVGADLDDVAAWAEGLDVAELEADEIRATAAELIFRLSTAPVPTPVAA